MERNHWIALGLGLALAAGCNNHRMTRYGTARANAPARSGAQTTDTENPSSTGSTSSTSTGTTSSTEMQSGTDSTSTAPDMQNQSGTTSGSIDTQNQSGTTSSGGVTGDTSMPATGTSNYGGVQSGASTDIHDQSGHTAAMNFIPYVVDSVNDDTIVLRPQEKANESGTQLQSGRELTLSVKDFQKLCRPHRTNGNSSSSSYGTGASSSGTGAAETGTAGSKYGSNERNNQSGTSESTTGSVSGTASGSASAKGSSSATLALPKVGDVVYVALDDSGNPVRIKRAHAGAMKNDTLDSTGSKGTTGNTTSGSLNGSDSGSSTTPD